MARALIHRAGSQTVTLAVDRPEGDFIWVASGQICRALTTCLVDPSA